MAVNEKPAKPATSPRVRVFTSVDDFERTLREVEEETASKYITYKKQYDFGEKNVQPSAERTTKWELKNVKFDFIPFQLIGTKVYECHLGKDRNVQKKDKYHATKQRQALEDHAFMARQRRVQDTKKMGCPAQFAVSHVMKFPDFKIAKDTTHNRNKASAALKAALANSPSAVEGIVELHTCFPTIDDHQNHATVGHVAELREPVDPRVIEQVERLTLAGARKVSEIKRHLHTFVNDELFRGQPPPSTTRRRYFPTDRDIWNVMTRLKDTTRNAQQDQANLQVLCTRWSSQGDCNIKFRASELKEDGTKTKLLFCYQTAWQRRLLQLYGQQMCLLDATYRTCRYSLPLFFLCVRTNVCYSVVGVFISHSEKTEDIAEALQVFKEWNADWHPSHFMVDFCEAEIGALEAEFPESEVLLCDFHREKAWVEWVRKRENGVSHAQETLLKLLRDVAAAATTEDYNEAISRLHESQLWGENERLRSWLNNKWLRATCIKRWVHAFKDENLRVAIYTNNGVERQNETLKYSHLDGSKKRSLCEMLTVVVTDFLPTAYRKAKHFHAEMLRAGLRANISVDTKEEAPELETIVVDCELEISLEAGSESETDNVNENENAGTSKNLDWLEINKIQLSQKDREALQKGQWLTDKHMNAAQHLIKSEYQLIDGLRDTVVLMANQSGPVSATSDSLQVHNIKDHRVLSSSTGGSITVYDSLQPSMKPELRSQLVHLYKQFAEGEDQIISVNVVCAQRQQGGNDCGLYAIANAAALAEDIHPTQVVFDQSQMRRHLEECLENNAIKMFPHSQADSGNGVPSRTYELSTYCSCYEHRPGAPMIMCDKCAQWFHYPCVNLSESAVHLLITQRQEYLCPKCVTA